MFHHFLNVWFGWVNAWGYAGVFLLMAMESSVIPVPSEIVMPPAAFWAAQGRMNFSGVILAGVMGSYFGSVLSYWISRLVGAPVVLRYGKFFLLPPAKIHLAQNWIKKYGSPGVFVARLLPVVRHLVSIPAGMLEMSFTGFSFYTLLGSGLWCAVLSWFGLKVIGSSPELLNSPEAMMAVMKAKLMWFIGAVIVLSALYVVAVSIKGKAVEDQV